MVVRPSNNTATIINSIRENADWRVGRATWQRIRAPGQRLFFGLRFILFLYFISPGEAMRERGMPRTKRSERRSPHSWFLRLDCVEVSHRSNVKDAVGGSRRATDGIA